MLKELFEILQSAPPVAIVWANEGGVFMHSGKYKRTLGPGIYLKWPFIDKVIAVNVQEQVINLANQRIQGADGSVYAVSATIRYEIEDCFKAILQCQDYDDCIQNYTMSAIASHIARDPELSYDRVCNEVLEELKTEAQDWGLSVTDLKLTDFGWCIPLSVVQ